MNTGEPRSLRNLSDDELLKLAQENDPAGFEELMGRNASASYRIALSVLKDRQDAEDAVQDSYLSAWRHIGHFHGESKFSTWITRIVTNQCLMRLRKGKRANFVYLDEGSCEDGSESIDLPDRKPSPEVELHERLFSSFLREEVGKLPPLFRSMLQLRYLEELSVEELARRSGITILAAKSRLLRARAELKRRLEKHRSTEAVRSRKTIAAGC